MPSVCISNCNDPLKNYRCQDVGKFTVVNYKKQLFIPCEEFGQYLHQGECECFVVTVIFCRSWANKGSIGFAIASKFSMMFPKERWQNKF